VLPLSKVVLTMRNLSATVDALLTPAEVAAILYVDPKTVTRWAMAGKISCVRTPGGHRRFLRSEILALATATRSHQRAPWVPPGDATPPPNPFGPHVSGVRPVAPAPGTVEDARQAAGAVVARAVAVAREVQAAHAAQAVVSTRFAVEAAAGIAAAAAAKARTGRATAAATAAEAVATSASQTAAAVQRQAEVSANALSEAATRAAAVVVAARASGDDHASALTALHLATTAQEAAVSAARDAAAAAAEVAKAVATAAAQVARTVSDLDAVIEGEVAEAAAAVQISAAATARVVAAESDARATSVAMLAQEAVVAAADPRQSDEPPRGPAHRTTLPGRSRGRSDGRS
jgi:excisionase family DNA binding protein